MGIKDLDIKPVDTAGEVLTAAFGDGFGPADGFDSLLATQQQDEALLAAHPQQSSTALRVGGEIAG